VPVAISGDPRSGLAGDPVPGPGAPCGVVDVLNFPLDPPDAEAASGGQDFGRFRSGYGLYHAGEDWRPSRRGTRLGAPVYSIGHGLVTYAQPLGWGVDQGVVIVRHTFSDGTQILSFYGHLDPSSVVLAVGECVTRGQEVGAIGKPRTSPHLHFEIRNHTPSAPGRGYSADDPTLSGWFPPSQTIWAQRLSASPGVLWTRSPVLHEIERVSMIDPDTFLAIEDERLTAIGVHDGAVRWQREGTARAHQAIVHPQTPVLYVIGVLGDLEAFPLPAPESGAASLPQAAWQIEIDGAIFPDMAPMPGGGVAVLTRRKMAGISPAGELLWEREAALWSCDWVLSGDQLVVTDGIGEIWTVTEEGAAAWESKAGGHLAVTDPGEHVLSYDEQGIHRLDLEARATELIYALPGTFPAYAEIVALPGGEVLVVHEDADGASLSLLSAEGALRWRRGLPDDQRGTRQLLGLDGDAYLVSEAYTSASSEVSVYWIDLERAELVRILVGGSRSPRPTDTWAVDAGDGRMLLHIGGTGMAVLDTSVSREAAASQP
jgi:hypothetical protein